MPSFHLPDPRHFVPMNEAHTDELIDYALAALAAEQGVIQEKQESALRDAMMAKLRDGDTEAIARALAQAPSLAVQRLLARTLALAHVAGGRSRGESDLPLTVFALPIIIVAGSAAPITLEATLPDVDELVALMKAGGALRGNQSFTLSNALASAAAFAIERLPASLDWWKLNPGAPIAIEPAPLSVPANQESVFLRFLMGTAWAGPGVDLLTARDTAPWGMPFTQALARQLAREGLTLLALPRPPQAPLSALYQGRVAQREVSLQLFVTHAVRKFRGSVGEPAAVISAHRLDDGRGEVRLSLSNPFDEKGAEGFRAELYATDRAQDVATAMQDLLRECQVEDVTTLGDVFPDIDHETRMPLLFRADALAGAVERALKTTTH